MNAKDNGFDVSIRQAIEEMKSELGECFSLENINLAELGLVKDYFLVGRSFWNVSDLNAAALEWCNRQNGIYHKAIDGVTQDIHFTDCAKVVSVLDGTLPIRFYLCPERKISFDEFINFEGRRFGVPYAYRGSTARIMRDNDVIYIYSADCMTLLASYDITWSRRDRYCDGQYPDIEQPEEFPSAPVRSKMTLLEEPKPVLSFEKFNFDKEVDFALVKHLIWISHQESLPLWSRNTQ